LTIAVSNYSDPAKNREEVRDAAEEFSRLFDGNTIVASNEHLSGQVVEAAIRDRLGAWGTSETQIGVVLWTGHGESGRLLTSDDSVAATTVADWLSGGSPGHRFDRWVVIIDACWAGSIARPIRDALDTKARAPDQAVFVLASANELDPSDAGIFTRSLAQVLARGAEEGWWGYQDELVEADEVNKRLDELIEPRLGFTAVPFPGGSRRPGRVFPNPRYSPSSVDVPLDEAHFLPKARGIEANETGWHFTGRVAALTTICRWLNDPSQTGLFVVSGAAGTGKSAVIGRIVTLSVPAYRDLVPREIFELAPEGTLPDVGAVTAAFHARERRVDELLRFLGDALGLEEATEAADLTTVVRGRADRMTIVVDALDEAARNHGRRMVDEILTPLVRAGAKVLVGTRPGVADWEERGVTEGHLVNLDDQPHATDDLVDYVTDRLVRLERSPYRDDRSTARLVAEAVARRCISHDETAKIEIPNFLVARILSRYLTELPRIDFQPGWDDALPNGFEEAFESDLYSYKRCLGPELAERVVAILEAIAWDEGSGIPRRHLPAITHAITATPVTSDDISATLREAAGHIIESTAEGFALYRLYHKQLREHLRDKTRRREPSVNEPDAAIHSRIASALIAAGEDDAWRNVDPYLAAVLPTHAEKARRLSSLTQSPGFLPAADPDSMAAALPYGADGTYGAAIRAYRAALPNLRTHDQDERALALAISAAQRQIEIQLGVRRFRLRYRAGLLHADTTTMTGGGPVVFGRLDDVPIAITGGGDATVRVWDLRRGQLIGEPLTVGGVSAVAFGRLDDVPIAITGGGDATVRVWDLRRSQPIGEPLRGHLGTVVAVAFGRLDDVPIAISAGFDKTVRMWDLRRRQPIGKPLTFESWSSTEAFGELGDAPIVIREGDGDFNATAQIWDLRRGRPIGEPLTGHHWGVAAAAFGHIDDAPIAITGGSYAGGVDGTVRVWDLRSSQAIGEPLTGHHGGVRAVAFGDIDDTPIAISGGDDATVRVWDLRSSQAIGEPLTGHHGTVSAVAFGHVDDTPIAITAGADATVRVWNLRPSPPVDTPPSWHHDGRVSALAFGHVDDTPIVITGGDDATVRVWDIRGGQPIGEPLRGHLDWVKAVAFGHVRDTPIAITAGFDEAVRVWDLRRGKQRWGQRAWVWAVAFGHLGRTPIAITAGERGTVRVWNLRRGQPIGEPLTGHRGRVRAVAFGHLGGTPIAISCGHDATVRVWNLRRGQPIGEPLAGHEGHEGGVSAVAFGHVDSTPIAISGGDDATVRVWNLRRGQPIGEPFTGHEGGVSAVAFGHLDSTPIAISSGDDATVRVWDLRRRQCILSLPVVERPTAVAVANGLVGVATNFGHLGIEIDGLTVEHRSSLRPSAASRRE
jgi:WD40 repeat protein